MSAVFRRIGTTVGIMAAASLVAFNGPSLASTKQHVSTGPDQSVGNSDRSSITEASVANELSSPINTLVQSPKYESVATAASPTAPNIVTVYVKETATPGLRTAVTNIARHAVTLRYVAVGTSWRDLLDLDSRVSASTARLAQLGLRPTAWGIDPAQGTVVVHSGQPSKAMVARMSNALQGPVTPALFGNAAQEVLQRTFGSRVRYAGVMTASFNFKARPPARQGGTEPDDRYFDAPPFTGGDQIAGGTFDQACTSNFMLLGQNTLKTYVLTAGHCGPGAWYSGSTTTGVKMGSVVTRYYNNGSDDFESIPPTGGMVANVYGNFPDTFHVTDSGDPAYMSKLTLDGGFSGQVRNNTVTLVNATLHATDLQGNYVTIAHLDLTNLPYACEARDSGGPVYSHLGNTINVRANGLLDLATFDENLNQIGCAFEQIQHIETASNSAVATGAALVELFVNGELHCFPSIRCC